MKTDLEPLWERLNARAQKWSDQPDGVPPVTGVRRAILDALSDGQPRTIKQLMAAAQRSKDTMYHFVRKLETSGVVVVTKDYRLLIQRKPR